MNRALGLTVLWIVSIHLSILTLNKEKRGLETDVGLCVWRLSSRKLLSKLSKLYLFINLHWLPIAAQCIKFKALLFSYKSTSGSAPLYLNSLLQTYMSSAFCKWMTHYCTIPKRHKITFTDFNINCSHLVEWPRTQSQQLNPYPSSRNG